MNGLAFRLVFFLALLFPTLAFADDPAAGDWKKRGDEAMDAFRYEEALDFYSRAIAASQDPSLYYNRGRVYQARSEYTLALDDMERFEREATPALKARVPKLGELLADLRNHVTTLTVHANVAGAEVRVREQPAGPIPVEALRVNSGAAVVEVRSEGYVTYRVEKTLASGPVTLDVTMQKADPAGAVVVPVKASPVPSDEPKRATASPITSKWWFWTGIGVVVVAAAGVTVFALTHEKAASSGDQFQPGQVSAPLLRF